MEEGGYIIFVTLFYNDNPLCSSKASLLTASEWSLFSNVVVVVVVEGKQ